MRELTVRELRAGYGAVKAALEADGEVVLTHHGRPYAKIVPIVLPADGADAVAERRNGLRAWGARQRRFLAGQAELPPFDWAAFREDR